MGPQELLPTGAGLVLEQVQLCGESVHLFVHPEAAGAPCPSCACWSEAFHSSYVRSIADLPIGDRRVMVHLEVRRFRCYEPTWRKSKPPPAVRRMLPGPQTLCWLLLRRRSELDDAERVLLTDLCRRSSELATSRRLAQRFMVLLRERRGTHLEGWIAEVQSTGPPELRGFSRNLHRDWQAVHAGFTVHWSSGPVEGNINRLKLIKRTMYGRANFDLLRKRVLLAS